MNRAAAAGVAVVLLAGCTPNRTAPAPAPEDPYQETTRWIPNASIDLMSPEGTFIRATAESWSRAWTAKSTGLDALKERGYPGFDHAFNDSFGPRIKDVGGYPDQISVGTEYNEVVALRHDGDRFIADVCLYTSQTATKQKDGQFYSRGSMPYGNGKHYVFGPDPKLPADQQHLPSVHQKGAAKAPSDNVFGTWVLFEMGTPDDVTLHGCMKLAPGTPEGLPDPYVRADPPPTLPPDPGWPEGSKA
ncbi:hypothetical protein [Mycobacteroides abscessus]|uniref:hypothetical protein n=1 Tax=Mycobacteroides abscessus TaxID=36809 RepID=UPI0009D27B47|nr:hypothetical protein [Mycobacteroides abscessus]SKG10200.1 Uncharacterised protein [Mycobacteroides abscessus subsp. massiliense]